jgi:UDP-glucose 4-epimerase
MKIVLTGATGFIGRHLVARLAKKHEIFTLVRKPNDLPPDCHLIPIIADLRLPLDHNHLPKTADVVAHLAQHNGRFPDQAPELYAVNTARTHDLLDYARRSGAVQFILASSGDVYGYRLDACSESDPVNPKGFYAATKRSSELLALAYEGFLVPTILRLFTPYGPGQTGRLVPGLATRILQGKPVRVHKEHRPMLTPTYIDDVIDACEAAIEAHAPGVFNVSGNEVVSVKDLAETLGRFLGKVPLFEQTGEDVGNLIGDNTSLREVLGIAAVTSLHEGLARTIA